LLEPFWPEGLGINRGFHTALDAVSSREFSKKLQPGPHRGKPGLIFMHLISLYLSPHLLPSSG
jgi:hypothetical protein